MPRYTLCPYYIDENRRTISCEDVIRRFDSIDEKYGYMDEYCDDAWEDCPYAIAMNKAYDLVEKGDEMAVEKNKLAALETELKGVHIKLGRAEKKIDELKEVNKSFIRRNEELESMRKRDYKRWREAQAKLDKGDDQIQQELAKLAVIYEQRMAYLIEKFAPGKKLVENDVKTWAGDKEFALVHDADKDNGLYWKVVYREDGTDIQSKTEE